MKFQVSQSEKEKTTLDPISDDTKDLLNWIRKSPQVVYNKGLLEHFA